MFNNLDIPGIDKKTREDIKAFFENTLNDVSLHIEDCTKKTMLTNMCEAFWEDVYISADLEKLFNFCDEIYIKDNAKEEKMLSDNKNIRYKLFGTGNGYEKVVESCLKLKRHVKPGTWEKIMPFFLYVAPDIDFKNLKNYKLDTFKMYNFLYSLGLLAGRNRENEGKSIIETVFNKIYKDKLRSKMKQNRDICKELITEKCKVLMKDDNDFKCPVKNLCKYILLYDFIKTSDNRAYNNPDKLIDLYEDLLNHSFICQYMKKCECQEIDEISCKYIKIYVDFYEYIEIYNYLESELNKTNCFLDERNSELIENISDLIEIIKEYLKEYAKRIRRLGKGSSGNFEYMRKFMRNHRNEVVNEGYVVYCFNMLTDWFNYSMYLYKRNINMLDYNGLALKQVTCNDLYMNSVAFILYDNKNGFWEEAEKRRENIVKNIISNWKVQDIVYNRHSELYYKMVNGMLRLGNKIDFLEYWLMRFGEENFELENIEL